MRSNNIRRGSPLLCPAFIEDFSDLLVFGSLKGGATCMFIH